MRILTVSSLLLCGLISMLFSQQISPQLLLSANDVRVEESPNSEGLLIYVRAKSGIGSVILTESAENPINLDINTYALRTSEYNIYNSDERRLLNGQFIQLQDGYFIIDSTAIFDNVFFQEAFILFLPYQVSYGYKNTRNGIIDFTQGTNVVNIRTFEKSYADYSGEYADNSFYIKKIDSSENIPPSVPEIGKLILPNDVITPPSLAELVETEEKENIDSIENIANQTSDDNPNKRSNFSRLFLEDTSRYSNETIVAFTEIADIMGSEPVYIDKSVDIPKNIVSTMYKIDPEKSIDVLILLDTTRSMWDDITAIKSSFVPLLQSTLADRNFRVGLVYYRDKDDDEYEVSEINFIDKSQLPLLQKKLELAQAVHGGDWPESVHEAMKVASENFTWLSQERLLFIVGDAPPHDPPRDGLNVDKIYERLQLNKINVYPFIVPIR